MMNYWDSYLESENVVINILMIFYLNIIKFYICKLIINNKYDLIVVSISYAFINISLNIGLEKFMLSYVFSFSYNLTHY